MKKTRRVDFLALRFGQERGRMPPLGPLYLCACLDRAGIPWQLTDTQFIERFHPFSISALIDLLEKLDAPVLAVSVFNDAVPLLIAALRETPKRAGRRIIVGGPGVVGVASRILDNCPAVDAVLVGEGETAFVNWLCDKPGAALAPGIFTRGDTVITGSARTQRENLDRIPAPAWHWCRGRQYEIVPWSTTRGCSFNCSFCEIVAFLGRRVTQMKVHRSIEHLTAGLKAINSLQVNILDDTFTVDKNRVLTICRALKDSRLNVSFTIFSRVDTLDDEMMEALAEAGCSSVFFGIDAGDDDILRAISKRITVQMAERAILKASRHFQVKASFIWGYPFESLEAVQRMLETCRRIGSYQSENPVDFRIQLLSPSAATPLFGVYGNDILLDLDAVTMPCNCALNSYAFSEDYDRIIEIIKKDKLIGAPFYRYRTPDFLRKQELVSIFERELDETLGLALIRAIAQ